MTLFVCVMLSHPPLFYMCAHKFIYGEIHVNFVCIKQRREREPGDKASVCVCTICVRVCV